MTSTPDKPKSTLTSDLSACVLFASIVSFSVTIGYWLGGEPFSIVHAAIWFVAFFAASYYLLEKA